MPIKLGILDFRAFAGKDRKRAWCFSLKLSAPFQYVSDVAGLSTAECIIIVVGGVTFNPHFVFFNLNPPYLFIYFLYPQTYIDLPDGNNFWIVMTVAPPNTYENKVITANTTPDVPYKKI